MTHGQDMYDSFLLNNSEYVKEYIEDVRKLNKKYGHIIGQMNEDEYDKFEEKMRDSLKHYDEENIELVFGALESGHLSMNEIADTAFSVTNRHGTEMSMTLDALGRGIDAFEDYFKKFNTRKQPLRQDEHLTIAGKVIRRPKYNR